MGKKCGNKFSQTTSDNLSYKLEHKVPYDNWPILINSVCMWVSSIRIKKFEFYPRYIRPMLKYS